MSQRHVGRKGKGGPLLCLDDHHLLAINDGGVNPEGPVLRNDRDLRVSNRHPGKRLLFGYGQIAVLFLDPLQGRDELGDLHSLGA